MASREHLDRLKTTDPDRVAAALGLRKGQGGRFFCPSCQPTGGKTPDLSLRNGKFTCFKCGEIKGGDVLELVRFASGLDFPQAVAWMEDLTGIRSAGKRGKSEGSRASQRPKAPPRANQAPKRANMANPDVLDAFLDACLPVTGDALKWLVEGKGIAPGTVKTMRLRFCGRTYPEIMDGLKQRFGEAALLEAGLLNKKGAKVYPTFWHYYAKKAGFLVIPYLLDRRPVYLKVRPPCGKEQAERLGLIRFMNAAIPAPCLYNVDVLKLKPDWILVCEGESDVLAALSGGYAAVGLPGAGKLKPEWIEDFRPFVDSAGRSTVYLAGDPDDAGEGGNVSVAVAFRKAGLPVPRPLPLPKGTDLCEYLARGKGEDAENAS